MVRQDLLTYLQQTWSLGECLSRPSLQVGKMGLTASVGGRPARGVLSPRLGKEAGGPVLQSQWRESTVSDQPGELAAERLRPQGRRKPWKKGVCLWRNGDCFLIEAQP